MEKYTKPQRLAIYKLAVIKLKKVIDNNECYASGFCWALFHAAREYSNKHKNAPTPKFNSNHDIKNSCFPEITKHRPPFHYGLFWWNTDVDGVLQRIYILETAIAELSK